MVVASAPRRRYENQERRDREIFLAARENMFFVPVIPNEMRNPSGFGSQEKEGFLTSFGMTVVLVFRGLFACYVMAFYGFLPQMAFNLNSPHTVNHAV